MRTLIPYLKHEFTNTLNISTNGYTNLKKYMIDQLKINENSRFELLEDEESLEIRFVESGRRKVSLCSSAYDTYKDGSQRLRLYLGKSISKGTHVATIENQSIILCK